MQLHPCLTAQLTDDGSSTDSKSLLNDKFRLINVIFSEELSELAMRSEEAASRADLDASLVGYKSTFWTLVESRFNEGFPAGGGYGMTFADLLHHVHPLFHQNITTVDPSTHGQFTAEKLMSVWKDLLKEHDTVMVKFTKSGNHDSSFTKAAMLSLKKADSSFVTSDARFNDDDLEDLEDDEFGMETGGWCCFTNSLPIIYLRMWLNDKPSLTCFVSRQIPQEVQLDTNNAAASKKRRAFDSSSVQNNNKTKKKSPIEIAAEAIVSYVKVKEAEALILRDINAALCDQLKNLCSLNLQGKELNYWKSRYLW